MSLEDLEERLEKIKSPKLQNQREVRAGPSPVYDPADLL
jgi:hypothetical protein